MGEKLIQYGGELQLSWLNLAHTGELKPLIIMKLLKTSGVK